MWKAWCLVLSGIEYDKSSGIVSGTLHELPKKPEQQIHKINQVEPVLEHWKNLRTKERTGTLLAKKN